MSVVLWKHSTEAAHQTRVSRCKLRIPWISCDIIALIWAGFCMEVSPNLTISVGKMIINHIFLTQTRVVFFLLDFQQDRWCEWSNLNSSGKTFAIWWIWPWLRWTTISSSLGKWHLEALQSQSRHSATHWGQWPCFWMLLGHLGLLFFISDCSCWLGFVQKLQYLKNISESQTIHNMSIACLQGEHYPGGHRKGSSCSWAENDPLNSETLKLAVSLPYPVVILILALGLTEMYRLTW